MSYIVEQRVYLNKYGGLLGTIRGLSPTLNISGVNASIVGNNSGCWNVNDHFRGISRGQWPVVNDQIMTHYDVSNTYSYPDAGSTLYDLRAATGGRNGTISGVSLDPIEQAFFFNGVGATISMSSSDYTSMGTSLSVEVVCRRDTTLTNVAQVLFNFAGSNTAGGYRFFAYNTGFVWDGGNGQSGVSTTISNGSNYHFVGVRTPSSILLYQNGALAGSFGGGGAGPNYSAPRIGYNSAPSAGERWIGMLYEFRVYNKALSANEVAFNFAVRRRRYNL